LNLIQLAVVGSSGWSLLLWQYVSRPVSVAALSVGLRPLIC